MVCLDLRGGDLRWRLARQAQPQLVQQHAVFGLGLRVARQGQFAPVGGGQVHVHHLHGLELGDHLARRGAAGQRPELGLERDLQAVGQEGHEDVGLDALFGLVEDRPDGQVVLDLLEGLLDLGELDVERPQARALRREVGAQQVAAFASAHLAQPARGPG